MFNKIKKRIADIGFSLNKQQNREGFRINILLGLFVFCCAAILFQSFKIQIMNGDEFYAMALESNGITITEKMPRGEITDRNGNVLAYSEPVDAIVFVPPEDFNASVAVDFANEYAPHITVPTEAVTEDVMREYVLATSEDWSEEYLSPEDQEAYKKENISTSEAYGIAKANIPEEELQFDAAEINEIAIWNQLNQGYANQTKYLKIEGVTNEEIAYVISESNEENPHLMMGTYWKRIYPYGDSMSNLIGKVSTPEQGIPYEEAEKYTSQGMALNEQVGVSGLEYYFDSVLRGQDQITKIYQDAEGNYQTKVVQEGHPGNSIQLTVDIEYQQELEEYTQDIILEMRGRIGGTADKAFVVAQNPNNGEIYAVVGRQYDPEDGTWVDISMGAITDAYAPGSIVKPATLTAGLSEGVVTQDEIIVDEPMYVLGSKPLHSVENFGPINGQEAIMYSSNIYMFEIAIRLGGGTYVPPINGEAQPLSGMDAQKSLDTLRYWQGQYGLGVPTGINLPYESTGMQGTQATAGYALDQAIGQYDTYTPMQISQYVSTLANGGTRYSPVIVDKIYNDEGIVTTFETQEMNQVDISPEDMEYIRYGMYMDTTDPRSSADHYFSDDVYESGGKSGTAEAYVDGELVYNVNFISFAPYEDPQISVAVYIPNGAAGGNNTYSYGASICSYATELWLNEYMPPPTAE